MAVILSLAGIVLGSVLFGAGLLANSGWVIALGLVLLLAASFRRHRLRCAVN